MPVYKTKYEPCEAERLSASRRLWPMMREEIASLGRSALLALPALGLLPWLVFVLAISLQTAGLLNNVPLPDEKTMVLLLSNPWELFILLLLCLWVGTGLISKDLRERTLEVFLGRGLTTLAYLSAKGMTLGGFLLLLTLLPAFFLILFHVGGSGDFSFLVKHGRALWGTALYTSIGMGGLLLFTLALSSLTSHPGRAAFYFIGILLFGSVGAAILSSATGSSLSFLLSLPVELYGLAANCLGTTTEFNISPIHSACYFTALIALAVGILAFRFSARRLLR